MIGPVTVITPSIPERVALLAEACESVNQQNVLPFAHLVYVDHARRDCAYAMNRLVDGVRTEWVCPLADDDILYPQHLERLLDASDGYDVVYSYADLSDWPANGVNMKLGLNQPFDEQRLREANYIPGGCTLIRTDLWREVGGTVEGAMHRHDHDWVFWLRALDAGAKFACVPEVTWKYRRHDVLQKQAELHGDNR